MGSNANKSEQRGWCKNELFCAYVATLFMGAPLFITILYVYFLVDFNFSPCSYIFLYLFH